jgi:uncharacterized protein YueI
MWIFKILTFLWPFIKELVLGEKTVRQAIKSNRWKLVLTIVICISFVVNLLAVPRLVVMANDYVKLNKKYELQTTVIKNLNDKVTKLEIELKTKPPIPKEETPTTVIVNGKRLPKIPKTVTSDTKNSIKNHFDKIKEKEESSF